MKIAKYALDNWTELRDYTPMDTIRYELKTLNRQFQLASKQKTATANNLIALQEKSFPRHSQALLTVLYAATAHRNGWISPMTSGMSIASVAVVRTLLPSATVSGASETATSSAWRRPPRCMLWQNLLLCWCRRPPSQTLVQEAANQLTAISRSVETYRSEMNKLASQLPEYPVVMEMYGVGGISRPAAHGGDWGCPPL